MANQLLAQSNALLRKHKVRFVDLKATDVTGALHHITLPVRPGILEKMLAEGVGFDGCGHMGRDGVRVHVQHASVGCGGEIGAGARAEIAACRDEGGG